MSFFLPRGLHLHFASQNPRCRDGCATLYEVPQLGCGLAKTPTPVSESLFSPVQVFTPKGLH